MIKQLLYRFFGSDTFTLVYRYDMTTGVLAEMYDKQGRFMCHVLSFLKPDLEYKLKSNMFVVDEFTNRPNGKLKLDPKAKIHLPRNITLNVIDRRMCNV